jgi:hypothetical protein
MVDKIPIDRVWAASNIQATPPGFDRLSTGYIAGEGAPQAGFSNFIQNRQDSYLKHLDERGMVDWSATALYQKGAFVWYNGQPYKAKITSINGNPEIETTVWETLAVSIDLPLVDIKAWSGSAATIPQGWILCNGQNGTVDLSGRFILSTNATGSDIHSMGGTDEKTTLASGAHSHIFSWAGVSYGTGLTAVEPAHTHTVDTQGAHVHDTPSQLTVLGIEGMPSHAHTIQTRNTGEGSSGSSVAGDAIQLTQPTGTETTGHAHGVSLNSSGGHNHGGVTMGALEHAHNVPVQDGHPHYADGDPDHTHTFPAFYPDHYILCFITRSA